MPEAHTPSDRRRLARFLVVGLSGVAVNLGVFTLTRMALRGIVTGPIRFALSNLAGFAVSVLTNFALNDAWTWGDRRAGGRSEALSRLGKYYLVCSLAGIVQLGVAWTCHVAAGVEEHLSVVVGIGCATGINFIANHFWTFRIAPEGQADPKP
jgi:dolichol-phosphate mannosyltransferase